jgi:hypothetical protein
VVRYIRGDKNGNYLLWYIWSRKSLSYPSIRYPCYPNRLYFGICCLPLGASNEIIPYPPWRGGAWPLLLAFWWRIVDHKSFPTKRDCNEISSVEVCNWIFTRVLLLGLWYIFNFKPQPMKFHRNPISLEKICDQLSF